MATATEREMILAACGGKRTNAAGFVRVNCPVCPGRVGKQDKDVSLGFRPLTGGFRCFRCGVNGRMHGDGYVLPTDAEQTDAPTVEIPLDDFYPLWTDAGWTSYSCRDARRYMRQRGFTRDHLAEADAHVALTGKYQGRVIIPHKDSDGEWWGFTGRRWYEDASPKVLYPKHMDRGRLFNEQALCDLTTTAPVMLVEGCLDALWYLPHCVASLGKPTAEHFKKLCLAVRPLVIVLDGDSWEEGRALMMRLRLRDVLAGYVRLPAGEDPNTVDPTWLQAQVLNAQVKALCTPSSHSPHSPTSSGANVESHSTRSTAS